jgi:hypothetical protein
MRSERRRRFGRSPLVKRSQLEAVCGDARHQLLLDWREVGAVPRLGRSALLGRVEDDRAAHVAVPVAFGLGPRIDQVGADAARETVGLEGRVQLLPVRVARPAEVVQVRQPLAHVGPAARAAFATFDGEIPAAMVLGGSTRRNRRGWVAIIVVIATLVVMMIAFVATITFVTVVVALSALVAAVAIMRTLREAIADFKEAGRAIGHFNFSDSNQLHAHRKACKDKTPVIVGLVRRRARLLPALPRAGAC